MRFFVRTVVWRAKWDAHSDKPGASVQGQYLVGGPYYLLTLGFG